MWECCDIQITSDSNTCVCIQEQTRKAARGSVRKANRNLEFNDSDADNIADSSDTGGQEFEIDRILKEQDGGFFVKWAGYDSDENTWEPESNVSAEAVRELRKKKQRRLPPSRHSPTLPTVQPTNNPDVDGVVRHGDNIDTDNSTSIEDILTVKIGSHVCFRPDHEPWMDGALYRGVGTTYLTGVISRQRCVRGVVDFEVRWTSTQYQSKKHVHYISKEKAMEGVVNHSRAVGVELGPNAWEVLCRPFHEAQAIDDIWDDFVEIGEENARFKSEEALPADQTEVEKIAEMEFHANARLKAPEDLFEREDGSFGTRLRSKYKPIFEHSAVSRFIAYLPISFWKKVVENTNLYGGHLKKPKVTLDEMMRFLGILFYMTLVDKGEHSNYWGPQVDDSLLNTGTVGLENVMTLKRFQHIRSNLCFRHDVNPADLKRDPAARVRPLLNLLKVRGSKFVDVGRNCAADETTIACRSWYARHLIVFNASEPTGKYHFKIYMCCCSTTWLALNFRLHCSSDLTSRLSGVEGDDAVARLQAATTHSSEVRKHVIEATRPIHGSKRIINTDNFYTSCQLLESLRLFGLYCRGTIRDNSKHFPRRFIVSKKDKEARGAMRQGVSIKNKIIAASSVDGSVVNIVSNADDSTLTQVQRLVSNKKTVFAAPSCVIEYNQGMQGVDRFDQLRSLQRIHNKEAH